MHKLPDHVRARLAKDQVDVVTLEQILARLPAEHRESLMQTISDEGGMWGISAEAGTPESFLIDKAFARVEGYQKINRQKN